MAGKKRILWVDDMNANRASALFPDIETKKLRTIDDAISEISGGHLYEYDLIVLDIDFSEGIKDAGKVINKLCEKIYISEEERNTTFLISSGGYLIYLYLIERGFPSSRVAFLTGNAGIVTQLRAYSKGAKGKELSKEEIVNIFIDEWNKIKNDERLEDENLAVQVIDEYISNLKLLGVRENPYLLDNNFSDIWVYLYSDKLGLVKEYIQKLNVPEKEVQELVNTGDMMIYRFHGANLESPMFFSKNDNDIQGHNLSDAKNWMQIQRDLSYTTRWLVLDGCDRTTNLINQNSTCAISKQKQLFRTTGNVEAIIGVLNQMSYIFDGLKASPQKGLYLQGISALLLPFEIPIKYNNDFVNKKASLACGNLSNGIVYAFARMAKQTRNYCAHNYFGSILDEKDMLFIMLIVLKVLVPDKQPEEANEMNGWYQSVLDVLVTDEINTFFEQDTISINNKLEAFRDKTYDCVLSLYTNHNIDNPYVIPSSVEAVNSLNAINILAIWGYNNRTNKQNMLDPNRRQYFMFTLCGFLTLWDISTTLVNEVFTPVEYQPYGDKISNQIFQYAIYKALTYDGDYIS